MNPSATAQRTLTLNVKRQDGPEAPPRWEVFSVPYRPGLNVIGLLNEIQRNPVDSSGRPTTPVALDCNCLEEVCGACTMVINGKVRQSCSALVDVLVAEKGDVITLEPMTKFPVVRDLVVNRAFMFEALKKVKGWIPIDGTHPLGPGPRMPPKLQQESYAYSRCMTCGCCLEVCPQVNARSDFIGAAAIGQVVLFNNHPTGAMNAHERLDALMEDGGIAECGNAQNCVRACPKDIPLTDAIALANRQANKRMVQKLLGE